MTMENQNQINQRLLDILREEAKRHGKRFNKNLALSIGKNSGTISNLLSGKRTASDDMKEKILKALGKDFSCLIHTDTPTNPEDDPKMQKALMDALAEIIRLNKRVSELEDQLREDSSGPADSLPTGTR